MLQTEFKSVDILRGIQERLGVYHPNLLHDVKIKPKREENIRKEFDKSVSFRDNDYSSLLTFQIETSALINNIFVSHLLGCNDVVIPMIIDEYKDLRERLTFFNDEIKRFKQIQEIRITPFKLSELKSCLISDLETFNHGFDLGINSKELVKENYV